MQGSRERVEAIAPVVVAGARLRGSQAFIGHRAMISEVSRRAGVTHNVADVDALATRVLTDGCITVHELTTTTMSNQRQVLEVRVLLFI